MKVQVLTNLALLIALLSTSISASDNRLQVKSYRVLEDNRLFQLNAGYTTPGHCVTGFRCRALGLTTLNCQTIPVPLPDLGSKCNDFGKRCGYDVKESRFDQSCDTTSGAGCIHDRRACSRVIEYFCVNKPVTILGITTWSCECDFASGYERWDGTVNVCVDYPAAGN
jgi:hypothetical protein